MRKQFIHGKPERRHQHHTLPVGASIECLDWHLRNLDIGWKVIKLVTVKEHKAIHKRLGIKRLSDSIIYN